MHLNVEVTLYLSLFPSVKVLSHMLPVFSQQQFIDGLGLVSLSQSDHIPPFSPRILYSSPVVLFC